MKRKGFISISIIYSLFFVFMLLMLLIMANYSVNRVKLDVYKKDIKVDYSSVDLESPHCSLSFSVASSVDGVSGTISANDEKSEIVGQKSYTFTKLKENKTYTFTDSQENVATCTIVVTRSKPAYRSCTRTPEYEEYCKSYSCPRTCNCSSTQYYCSYCRACAVDNGYQGSGYACGYKVPSSGCDYYQWEWRDYQGWNCSNTRSGSCDTCYDACCKDTRIKGYKDCTLPSTWSETPCEESTTIKCENGTMYSASLEEL